LRLLLDEMYAPAVAVELRARGHDVLSVHEADPALVGAADSEVLSAAVSAERVLVTENVRDFRPLEIAILEGAITTTGSSTPATVSSLAARRERPGDLVRALDTLMRASPTLRDRSVFPARASG
jgi:predicted nuclease of predicted toxin-antitoxin system